MAKKPRRGHKKKSIRKTPRGLAPDQKGRRDSNSSRLNGHGTDDEDQPILTNPEPVAHRGRGDSGVLLTDPHRQRSDIQLVEQAIKKGWNVRRKTMIRRRLEDIVEKKTATVITKEGLVECESAADKLAIDASKVLVQMDASDVKRYDSLKPPVDPAAPTTNVQVNINVDDDPRRARLIELAQRLGARSLSIDATGVNLTRSDASVDKSKGEGTQEVTNSWKAPNKASPPTG